MSIGSVEQGPCRTDLDAVAALRTIQPTTVGTDDRVGAAIAGLNRVFAHPFIADTRAAFTKNTALRIVGDHGREIFFRPGIFLLNKSLFQIAPIKGQLL